ncbi:hypothetical protein BV898_08918 [Hypsibius exemplaris]|uniref:MARVEL domain-containing protein n=1 Tax=Hypsibius exemplaris TaxID=2072580 RepID=A0A1W0WP10_HYPEX|nr:hypothetical protein BV898_08918 [Hypsibius exemplaris]
MPESGSIKSHNQHRSASQKSSSVRSHPRRDGAGGGSVKSAKFNREGSAYSTRTQHSRTSIVDAIVQVEGPLHRRPMVSRSPGSFKRVAIFHTLCGIIAVFCQITVTVILTQVGDKITLFHTESPNAGNVGKASVGIAAGTMYLLLGGYGFYMAQKLFSFPSDVLKNKLWCFNVLNGLSIIASLLLFGASSFMAKSSACWYDDLPSSEAASAILAMALLLTVTACFEICVGASGVFVK